MLRFQLNFIIAIASLNLITEGQISTNNPINYQYNDEQRIVVGDSINDETLQDSTTLNDSGHNLKLKGSSSSKPKPKPKPKPTTKPKHPSHGADPDLCLTEFGEVVDCDSCLDENGEEVDCDGALKSITSAAALIGLIAFALI